MTFIFSPDFKDSNETNPVVTSSKVAPLSSFTLNEVPRTVIFVLLVVMEKGRLESWATSKNASPDNATSLAWSPKLFAYLILELLFINIC